jgi:hypothetical protein
MSRCIHGLQEEQCAYCQGYEVSNPYINTTLAAKINKRRKARAVSKVSSIHFDMIAREVLETAQRNGTA